MAAAALLELNDLRVATMRLVMWPSESASRWRLAAFIRAACATGVCGAVNRRPRPTLGLGATGSDCRSPSQARTVLLEVSTSAAACKFYFDLVRLLSWLHETAELKEKQQIAAMPLPLRLQPEAGPGAYKSLLLKSAAPSTC